MANKIKITGKSKLLEREESEGNIAEPLDLGTPKRKKSVLKNYRLTPLDIDNLSKIVKEVNEQSPYKVISETQIIKALILIGSKIKPDRIIKASQEVM